MVHLQPDVRRQLTHRATLWPEAVRDWTGGTHHFHESALRDAGFAEAGAVWQDLQTRVIAGLR